MRRTGKTKMTGSMKKTAKSLALGLGLLWAVLMLLLTLLTAYAIYVILGEHGVEYPNGVVAVCYLREYYYDSDSPWYGKQKEQPEHLYNDLLNAYRGRNGSYLCWVQDSATPLSEILLPDITLPIETAVLFYDSQKELVLQNGDYLTFHWCAAEELERYEDTSPDHRGWIDLSELPDAAAFYSKLTNNKADNIGNLFDFGCLRITGQWSGPANTKLIPQKIELINYNYLDETELFSDHYPTREFCLQEKEGTLPWTTLYENPDTPDSSVTVYGWNPEVTLYESSPVRYSGEKYDNLAALTKAFTDEAKGNTGFPYNLSPFSEYSLTRIRFFFGDSFTFEPEISPNTGRVLTKPELYMITAFYCSPLWCAVCVLRRVYLITAALAVIVGRLLYKQFKKRLLLPMGRLTDGAEKGWSHIFSAEQLESFWSEPRYFYDQYQDGLARDRRSQNEITRLNTALKYAEEAEARRRAMTSAIAHELKTPLAVVHSYAEGLQENIAAEKREAYLETILAETERMDAMVLEMLDLSRLEAGRVKLSQDETDLSALTAATVEKLQPLADRRGLDFTVTAPETLPVTADEARIAQVIENLVSNAVRYAKENTAVQIMMDRRAGKVSFSIENETEKLLSSEELSRVWETFYRADKARSEKGTGLGLAIAKNIVELHGGSVQATNTKTGVRFSFTLPE